MTEQIVERNYRAKSVRAEVPINVIYNKFRDPAYQFVV